MERRRREFIKLSLDELRIRASSGQGTVDKANALYEFACRALEDRGLVPEAWRLIGDEIEPRMHVPAAGTVAAAELLDRQDDASEAAMVEVINGWSSGRQLCFFTGLFDARERVSEFARLVDERGLKPRILIDDDGTVHEFV